MTNGLRGMLRNILHEVCNEIVALEYPQFFFPKKRLTPDFIG